MYKLDLEKAEEPNIKCQHPLDLRASLVAQMVKNLLGMWEIRVQSLGWEDHLEEEMTTHSSILGEFYGRGAWWATVMGLQRVIHD